MFEFKSSPCKYDLNAGTQIVKCKLYQVGAEKSTQSIYVLHRYEYDKLFLMEKL